MAFSILITRPEPAASVFARRLRERLNDEARIVLAPLMRIDPVPDALPRLTGYGAILITSAHAIPMVASSPEAAHLPCYCVGAATAQAAEAAGLRAVAGGGTAQDLADQLLTDRPPTPLLYARGEHVASDLAQSLNSGGLEVQEAVVYHQTSVALSEDARILLSRKAPIILPLFSPRSARLFFDQAAFSAPLFVAAISDNASKFVPKDQLADMIIAESPTADAMLDAIEALVSRAKRVESG